MWDRVCTQAANLWIFRSFQQRYVRTVATGPILEDRTGVMLASCSFGVNSLHLVGLHVGLLHNRLAVVFMLKCLECISLQRIINSSLGKRELI